MGAGRHCRTRHPQQELIKSTHYGYQTLLPSFDEIPFGGCYSRPAHLLARWLVPLLAGVADDGRFVCADVRCRIDIDGEESGIASQTLEC